jgi:hypothetical protein
MLAEHGAFGLLAALVLLSLSALNVKRAVESRERAVIAAVVTWALLFLAAYGFRIVAPALLLGFAFSTLSLEGEDES